MPFVLYTVSLEFNQMSWNPTFNVRKYNRAE